MYSDFRIAVYATLKYHCLGAEVEVVGEILTQGITECGQVKQCVAVIVRVVFRFKLQYLAQLLVGC